MPLPGKRISRSRTRRRRSHHALKPTMLTVCPSCKMEIVPHQACSSCGMYKGQQAISVAHRMERLLKRATARRAKKEEPESKSKTHEEHDHEGHPTEAHAISHKHDRAEGEPAAKDKVGNKLKRLFRKTPE